MGIFQVRLEVLPADGGPVRVASALVDPGASSLSTPPRKYGDVFPPVRGELVEPRTPYRPSTSSGRTAIGLMAPYLRDGVRRLPRSPTRSPGYRAIGRQRLIPGSGEAAAWELAEIRGGLEGRQRSVLAFLGSEQTPKLPGAQTHETFGLGVDPWGERLIPVDPYLA